MLDHDPDRNWDASSKTIQLDRLTNRLARLNRDAERLAEALRRNDKTK